MKGNISQDRILIVTIAILMKTYLMMDRKPHLLEIYKAVENNDLATRLEQLQELTNSLYKLTQSLFDNKVVLKYHNQELEGKCFRFGLANHSIINLLRGNELLLINRELKITDLFSIYSLTRMQIEAFGIMYYLFFDDIATIERDFRYDIYRLHGLQKQYNFPISGKDNLKKKEKIGVEIDRVKSNIKASPIFKEANPKIQKTYLKPVRAKMQKTEDIYKKSEVNASQIKVIWNLYSNHAHGEHISDRQFNYMYKINKSTLEEGMTVLNIQFILTSHLCKLISREFKEVQNTYDQLDLREKVQIETWSNLN